MLGILAYLSGHIVYADYLNIMYIPGSGELVVFAAALLGALRGRYDPFFYVKAAPRAQKGEVWRLCMENACLPPFYDLPSLLRAVSEEVHI